MLHHSQCRSKKTRYMVLPVVTVPPFQNQSCTSIVYSERNRERIETPTLWILPHFYGKGPLNTEYRNGAYSYGEQSYIELAAYQPFNRSSVAPCKLPWAAYHASQQEVPYSGKIWQRFYFGELANLIFSPL